MVYHDLKCVGLDNIIHPMWSIFILIQGIGNRNGSRQHRESKDKKYQILCGVKDMNKGNYEAHNSSGVAEINHDGDLSRTFSAMGLLISASVATFLDKKNCSLFSNVQCSASSDLELSRPIRHLHAAQILLSVALKAPQR
jgi:hypothetical protein